MLLGAFLRHWTPSGILKFRCSVSGAGVHGIGSEVSPGLWAEGLGASDLKLSQPSVSGPGMNPRAAC